MDVERFRRYTQLIQDAASGPSSLLGGWDLTPFADALHHPDVVQLVEHLEALGNQSFRVLSSDCWRVARDPEWERLLDGLRKQNVWGIQVTLYGMGKTHDWFAGKRGSFTATGRAVERLLEKGFQIAWEIILHERNAPEVDEILGWIEARVSDPQINISTFHFSGRGEQHVADAISPESFALLSPKARACIREDLRTEHEWWQLAVDGQFPMQAVWERMSRVILLLVFHDGAVAGGINGCISLGHMDTDSLADLIVRHDHLVLPSYEEQRTREQELVAWIAEQRELPTEDKLSTARNQLALWRMKQP